MDDLTRAPLDLPAWPKEDGELPAILIASGTEFAPIKSTIKHDIRFGLKHRLHLYGGGNSRADRHLQVSSRGRAERQRRFTWARRTGFVHTAVQEAYTDMSELEAYARGARVMIEAARLRGCNPGHSLAVHSCRRATPRPRRLRSRRAEA